jgi:hypothetical protein
MIQDLKTTDESNKITIEALKKLKNSTLFNLSLGSKELFHSNFIGWLAENYSLEVGSAFSRFINENKSNNLKLNEREKENIDLIFTYEDNQVLIIENKVKSLPSISQLEKYSKNHNSNKNYLLLSLYKPEFIDENNQFIINDTIKWNFLSYKELAILIKNIKPKTDYDKFIIDDYISFIENLSLLESAIIIDWEKDTFNFYRGDEIDEHLNFRKLRIHDFYLKHKYNQIQNKIIEEITKLEKNSKLVFDGEWLDGNEGECFFENGFTRSQGLVGFKYIVKKVKYQSPLVLGLQLQGNSLRLIVECPDGQVALNTARELKDQGFWFNFSQLTDYQDDVVVKGKGNNLTEFASFSGIFFYKYVNIDNIKMIDLIRLISDFYFYINNNFQKIYKNVII